MFSKFYQFIHQITSFLDNKTEKDLNHYTNMDNYHYHKRNNQENNKNNNIDYKAIKSRHKVKIIFY